MLLEPQLLKLPIVKGAELRRAATEGPDELELPCDRVNREAEAGLLRKHEALARFAFHFRERFSRCPQDCVQVDATVRRKREVADPVRDLERPMDQVTAAADMSCPGHHVTCEDHVGPRLEALDRFFFGQPIAELAEF